MTPIPSPTASFQPINRGFHTVFRPGRLSVGLVVPIETYAPGPVPSLERHLERVQLAEHLGFAAVWLRDVPFNVPAFGDAGQLFDPFVYLGYLAASTERIALGVASIILPLRHPAHVAKAAASADVLSGGRLLLGVASGDRPVEYPAMHRSFDDRGQRFRDSYEYIRRMADSFPTLQSAQGTLGGEIDMLPKPTSGRLPMLITGGSQQSPEWLANHGDGWMVYPHDPAHLSRTITDWRTRIRASNHPDRPVMQPLYVDLASDPKTRPQPIHLGFRLGTDRLVEHLRRLEAIGMNHVAINLRFNRLDTEETLARLAEDVLPHFVHQGPIATTTP